jgi:mRNA interferase RelE/StbE
LSYKIFETDNFIEEITELNKYIKNLEEKLIEYVYPQLRENPFFGKNIKKLKGYKPDTWRYRIGKLRLFYEIDDKEILVLMISASQRKDSY